MSKLQVPTLTEVATFTKEQWDNLHSRREEDRGSGRTRAQMLVAPNNAVFIWCSDHVDYPKALAHKLLRADLKVVPLSWLDWPPGDKNITGVVVDHWTYMSPLRQINLDRVLATVRASMYAGS